MTEVQKQRIYYWDNLKFILIALVVIGHFADVQIADFEGFKSIFLYIYMFHMPLFIFVTGFFAKRIINSDGKDRLNKIIEYLLLYIILKIILYVIAFCFGYRGSFNIFTEQEIPWYLMACALWLMVTAVIKNVKPKYMISFSVIIALLVGYSANITDQFALSRVITFYPFFLAGYYLSKESANKFIEKIHEKKYVIISIFILLTLLIITVLFIDKLYFIRPMLTARNPYLYMTFPFDIPFTGAFFRLFWFLFASIVSICVMAIIPRRKLFFSILGTRTLQIYSLHMLIINLLAYSGILNNFRIFFGTFWPLIVIIMGIGLTFLLSIKVLEKPFNKIMHMNLKKIYSR